jgi:predicted nucleic acid-binding protein
MSDSSTFLLDSNTVMYLIKGDEKVLQLIDNKIVAINFIIEIELLGWRLMSPELQDIIQNLIKDVHYFDYSHRVKQRTISLRQKYNFKLADAFIAATALEFDLTLVSADRIFSKIDDLRLINFIPSR